MISTVLNRFFRPGSRLSQIWQLQDPQDERRDRLAGTGEAGGVLDAAR